jgi:peptidase E
MVEVHKQLLRGLKGSPKAVFLDTPAGFQLNADQLSQRAVEYFHKRVQKTMSVASFKSSKTAPIKAEQAFQDLRSADFVLIGPGSPTYAVRHWKSNPIPEILTERVKQGGCLVAASAAALTVGRFTLPVYEIYKVGEELHWVEGVDILGAFGFRLAVVPHWNNSEGGTHDTRFCYMGEPRFRQLESQLPSDVSVLGLDEHTACLMDLEREEAEIKGIGGAVLRHQGAELSFHKGDRIPLDLLRRKTRGKTWSPKQGAPPSLETLPIPQEETSFWDRLHAIEERLRVGLGKHDPETAASALLDLDQAVWEAHRDLESDEFISQAREIFRECIVALGVSYQSSSVGRADCLTPLVDALLALREKWRGQKAWKAADDMRETLTQAGIIVQDTEHGPQWRLSTSSAS